MLSERSVCFSFIRLIIVNIILYLKFSRVICMLEENYRSHPDIIRIPSELFYYNRLFASIAFKQKNALCNWEILPKKVLTFK